MQKDMQRSQQGTRSTHHRGRRRGESRRRRRRSRRAISGCYRGGGGGFRGGGLIGVFFNLLIVHVECHLQEIPHIFLSLFLWIDEVKEKIVNISYNSKKKFPIFVLHYSITLSFISYALFNLFQFAHFFQNIFHSRSMGTGISYVLNADREVYQYPLHIRCFPNSCFVDGSKQSSDSISFAPNQIICIQEVLTTR